MCRKYESLTHGFNDDAPVRQAPEEEPYIEDKTKIHGFNDDAPAGILLISMTAWTRSRIRLGSAAMVIQWIDYSNKFHI